MKSTIASQEALSNRIGYACKVIGVEGTAVRTCTLRTATLEKLRETVGHNLAALRRIVAFNQRSGINLFRISSDVVPLATHPDAIFPWRTIFAGELAELGRAIAASGLRVSMHPGQYTVLNSPDEGVATRAVEDLVYHADVLDALGAGREAKIVLHVGGVYGDKPAAVKRFRQRFRALPKHVARRLVLENDEKSYAIDEVHAIATAVGLPVVMDVFHHHLLPPASGGGMEEWLDKSASTWKKADGRPKIHYSEQMPGGKPGVHSRTIDGRRFAEFHAAIADRPLDIMLEVKDKNLSAIKCQNCIQPSLPRTALTDEWARYKYAVLERSPQDYLRIRQLLKSRRPSPLDFYTLVDGALARESTPGTEANAAQHVWGYFKDLADSKEKRRFESFFKKTAPTSIAAVKRFLYTLAGTYKVPYLLNSLYFYL